MLSATAKASAGLDSRECIADIDVCQWFDDDAPTPVG